MNNRKGVIGTTITWMIGFVIIFFIIILFMTTSALLAAKKHISSYDPRSNSGTNEISVKGNEMKGSSFEAYRDLNNFLVSGAKENEAGVEDLLKEYAKSKNSDSLKEIQKKSEEYFSFYDSCYYFCLQMGGNVGNSLFEKEFGGKNCSPSTSCYQLDSIGSQNGYVSAVRDFYDDKGKYLSIKFFEKIN